jgi:uncharacterized protein YdaU (DUF1376 family)
MSITWFKLPIAEYLKETRRLSLEAKGAYLALLCDYYENGPIPNNSEAIDNIIGGAEGEAIWQEIAASRLFILDLSEQEWHHLRADKEIADRGKATERAVTNGSKGGRKPGHKVTEETSSEVLEQLKPMLKPTTLAIITSEGDDAPDLTTAPRVETTTSFIGKPPAPEPELDDDDDEPFIPMPKDFKLTPADIARCRANAVGVTWDQIAEWFDEFKAKHLAAGTTAQDWTQAWFARLDTRVKQVNKNRPRVEVSRKG